MQKQIRSWCAVLAVAWLVFPHFALAEIFPLGAAWSGLITTYDTLNNLVNADSTPTCAFYIGTSSTPVYTGATVTNISTGLYRVTATLSSGNGFAAGSSYAGGCTAIVSAQTQTLVVSAGLYLTGTPSTAGVLPVDVSRINNVATTSVTTVSANQGTTQPLNFTGTGGAALVHTDLIDITGSAVSTSTAQLGVNVVSAAGTNWGNGAITAASVAADAGTEIGTAAWAAPTRQLTGTQAYNNTGNLTGNVSGSVGSVTGNVGGNVTGTVGGMTAAGIASTFFTTNSTKTYIDAVGGSPVKETADNAAASSGALVTGTADTGTTTTMVDAALNQADTNYWRGQTLCFTNGNIQGQCASIELFDPALDTITFAPAVTQSVNTQSYSIYPMTSAWDENIANHLTAGSTGNSLNSASSAGDPLNTAIPGAYAAGTAGYILGNQVLRSSVNNRPVDVNASGNVGIDLADVDAQSTALNLSGTTIATVTNLTNAPTAGDLTATMKTSVTTAVNSADFVTFQDGVAYPGYVVFMRRTGTVATGATGQTLACTRNTFNGSVWSGFTSTGVSNIVELGLGNYSIDLSGASIGKTTVIHCEGTGGSGASDIFQQNVYAQR